MSTRNMPNSFAHLTDLQLKQRMMLIRRIMDKDQNMVLDLKSDMHVLWEMMRSVRKEMKKRHTAQRPVAVRDKGLKALQIEHENANPSDFTKYFSRRDPELKSLKEQSSL